MSTVTRVEQAIPAGTWKLDPVHSRVGFAVRHAGVSLFKGGLDEFDAVLAGGTLRGSAKVASITVQDENLRAHLLSPEFFDAERFPEVLFTSTSLRREGDRLQVEGELEIRGTRRPVTLAGTIAGPANGRLGIALQTAVDRTDFGMTWNMELPDGGVALENEVALTADLELVEAR
jgi:polyisoprenoid-binding protein YceI